MELSLQEKIALTCNVLAAEGQSDLNLGHVSARFDPPETYLIKGYGLGLEEVTADDVIRMDLDGNQLAGALRPHRELTIHAEIYRARPDVMAVVHTHPPYATAFSAVDRPLVPISHEGAVFAGGLPVFSDTTDVLTRPEQGRQLAAALGEHDAVLMRNHGITTVGRSVEEACLVALFLEKAVQLFLLAELFGGATAPGGDELLAKKANLAHLKNASATWEYLVRRTKHGGVPSGAEFLTG